MRQYQAEIRRRSFDFSSLKIKEFRRLIVGIASLGPLATRPLARYALYAFRVDTRAKNRGPLALRYALGGEEHEGTAIFYGSLVTDPKVLASIDHEVYGSFAEMDNGIPPETVNAFVAALRTAGVENDVHIYDDVNHGFWLRIDQDPELRTAPALDAWQRLRAYLTRALSD